MKPLTETHVLDANTYNKIYSTLLYLVAISLAIMVLLFSLKREAFNYGTETDFLGSFVPEAVRFLNSQALEVQFHPPFYSIVLGLVYSLTGDWMKSGLLLSLISSIVILISSHQFFTRSFGTIAGIGAILSLLISPTFIAFSLQATTDVFFTALFFAALALISLAQTKDTTPTWLLAGTVTGAAIITRTNGIALSGFLLFPLTSDRTRTFRIKAISSLLLGMLIPIVAWLCFAIYSGSPPLPTSNYKSLALTYFAEGNDRITGDALSRASRNFSNTWEVLAKDPTRIVWTYVRDLALNTRRLFSDETLLPFPYIQLGLPGLFVLIFTNFNKFTQVLALNLLGIFLFLNFKAWDTRYFLYIVPFMGAGIGCLLNVAYSQISSRKNPFVLCAVVMFFLLSSMFSIRQMRDSLAYHFETISSDSLQAANVVKNDSLSKNAIVIARKPHLGFYAKLDSKWFPNVESMEDLKPALKEMVADEIDGSKIYLFYGFAETYHRPKLAGLRRVDLNVRWLRRVGRGQESGGWVLYEVLRSRL